MHLSELIHVLQIHQPHIVFLQETWLDASVENIRIDGYNIVSRRDRKATANRGGLLTLQRQDFNCLVHIKNCEMEERSLHFLRVDVETFLVINWYRPGSSDHDGFQELYKELKMYTGQISEKA